MNNYLRDEEQIGLSLLAAEGFGPEQKRAWYNVVYTVVTRSLFTTRHQLLLQNQPGFCRVGQGVAAMNLRVAEFRG